MPCSNAAKTQNPLKFAGVPQTRKRISVANGPPYCGDMWRRYCCLSSFFSDCRYVPCCEDIAQQSCAIVCRWQIFLQFLGCSISSVQHVSDMHSERVPDCNAAGLGDKVSDNRRTVNKLLSEDGSDHARLSVCMSASQRRPPGYKQVSVDFVLYAYQRQFVIHPLVHPSS